MHCLPGGLASQVKAKKKCKHICERCKCDKSNPKKFSRENKMIPSKVPPERDGLNEIEQMLIARILPIMRVYIKPGGQKGYSGHCISMTRQVREVAKRLPHFPKDLAITVVRMKGKNESFKDVTVRRECLLL